MRDGDGGILKACECNPGSGTLARLSSSLCIMGRRYGRRLLGPWGALWSPFGLVLRAQSSAPLHSAPDSRPLPCMAFSRCSTVGMGSRHSVMCDTRIWQPSVTLLSFPTNVLRRGISSEQTLSYVELGAGNTAYAQAFYLLFGLAQRGTAVISLWTEAYPTPHASTPDFSDTAPSQRPRNPCHFCAGLIERGGDSLYPKHNEKRRGRRNGLGRSPAEVTAISAKSTNTHTHRVTHASNPIRQNRFQPISTFDSRARAPPRRHARHPTDPFHHTSSDNPFRCLCCCRHRIRPAQDEKHKAYEYCPEGAGAESRKHSFSAKIRRTARQRNTRAWRRGRRRGRHDMGRCS